MIFSRETKPWAARHFCFLRVPFLYLSQWTEDSARRSDRGCNMTGGVKGGRVFHERRTRERISKRHSSHDRPYLRVQSSYEPKDTANRPDLHLGYKRPASNAA